DGKNRVLRVGDSLPLGHLANQTLPGLGKCHNGWRGAPAFLIGDNFGLATFHHRHNRIRGTEVDTDNLCHWNSLRSKLLSRRCLETMWETKRTSSGISLTT